MQVADKTDVKRSEPKNKYKKTKSGGKSLIQASIFVKDGAQKSTIKNYLKDKEKVEFRELFDVYNKSYVVVTFLAILDKYNASAKAVFPPPTTATFFFLKKCPSQVAQ